MNIARDKYLRDLINRMNNGMIKVVTGIRRSGKSYLLFKLFYEYLLSQGVLESHIIKIELDQRKNRIYRDPDVILDYIETLIEDDKQYYILLDEVQMLNDFEEVLNSLLHISNADIYVTGSNSKFLSKDVITEFRAEVMRFMFSHSLSKNLCKYMTETCIVALRIILFMADCRLFRL